MQMIEALPAAPGRTAPDGAHAIYEVLRDWGVDLILTCPGSTEAAVLDASLDFPEMRLVLTTHESIAVAAADAYARLSGRPAVAYLHANVGLANGIAHLSCASGTQTPLLILNGMKSTQLANRGGFTTSAYQSDPVRQYVCSARVTLRSDEIAEDLTHALQAATGEPGGPVYLGLPQDIVEATQPVRLPDIAARRHSSRRRPDPESVAAAVRLLTGARSVTIVAGSEVASADGRRALLALADRLEAPILIEDRRTLARTGITGATPGFAGAYAPDHPAVVDCDVLLFAGMRSFIEFEPRAASFLPPGARVVHLVNESTEIAKIERVDVGLVGNAALGLADLLAAVETNPNVARRAHRDAAVAALRSARTTYLSAQRARYAESPIQPSVLCAALADELPADAIVVSDAVTTNGYAMEALIPESHREFITTTGGSLGWGMGAALGAQLAKPEARVVCLIGDGVFQFGIQALWTASALQLPVTFVVIDNASYAAVKAALKRFRRRSPGPDPGVFPASDIGGPEIAAIARGFGVHAQVIDRIADLRGALQRAFTAGPSVIVVKTDTTHTGP
jgi:benzoylformate decarboxylase